MLHPGMRTSLIFKTQNVLTRHNSVAKRTQHVAPDNVATCCAEMLLSFGRSLLTLGQQLSLGYVVLICCDRLAGALQL